MANNLGSFEKAVETVGISEVQPKLSTNNKKCVVRFLYKGIESCSVANYNKQEFLNLFETLKKAKVMEEVQAIMRGQSVASQKVNDAHGNDILKKNINYLQQNRTYATDDRTRLKGVKISDAVMLYLNNTISKYNAIGMLNASYMPCVIESLSDWHNISHEQARNMLANMIKNHEVCVVNEHVFSHDEFKNLVKNWHGENDIPCTHEKIENLTCKLMEKLHGTYTSDYNKKLSYREIEQRKQDFLSNAVDMLIKGLEDNKEFKERLEKRYFGIGA